MGSKAPDPGQLMPRSRRWLKNRAVGVLQLQEVQVYVGGWRGRNPLRDMTATNQSWSQEGIFHPPARRYLKPWPWGSKGTHGMWTSWQGQVLP